jgi:hypothetical protein
MSTAQAIAVVVVITGIGWYFFGGGLEQQSAVDPEGIQLAADAVRQYEIIKRSGSAIDACAQAGLVSAAFLQAQDQTSYTFWKYREKVDCQEAGVER